MIPVLSIPVLNRYDLLDMNLESIDFPIKEILIINNGLEEYIPKRKDLNVRVLNLPSNLGLSASWNLTIKLYPYEKYWLFSSADTHWLPGSLKKFFEMSGESKMIGSSEGFSCFSVGEDVIRKVGLWDERFYPYGCEDDDYYDRFMNVAKKENSELFMFLNRAIEVSTPFGTSQTVKSDIKLDRGSLYTYPKNKEYYLLKKSQGFSIMGSWDIDVRRDHEWL